MIRKFREALPLLKWGINALAWDKEGALKFIKSIEDDEIGILGGDVYFHNTEDVKFSYDSWCVNKKSSETLKEFNKRSKQESFEYIFKYPVVKKTLFSFVLTDNSDVNAILDINPDYSVESAQIIEKPWLMCPYCTDTWKEEFTDKYIWCPTCKKKCLNPFNI